ncbi:MAG: hypothetical protein JWR08_1057 [Enterovirga sp.]|nr:hypothetical protein [Enterovirga sp.]
MVNLFDIVRRAQSGSALDNLSQQYGLNLDQTQRAVEALLPAFTLGFERSARDPMMFARILELMTSGRFAPFFDARQSQPSLQSSGQQVLDQLFGSPELSRQVAAQASATTGIALQVMQQMLPSVAAMVMGGLFRFASVDGLADFLRAWADWLRTLKQPDMHMARPAGSNPMAAWGDLMSSFAGGAKEPPKPAPQADPWSSFMQGMMGQPVPKPPPPPPAQPKPFEVLSQMIDTGREVQAQHLANLQTVFDGFMGGRPSS